MMTTLCSSGRMGLIRSPAATSRSSSTGLEVHAAPLHFGRLEFLEQVFLAVVDPKTGRRVPDAVDLGRDLPCR